MIALLHDLRDALRSTSRIRASPRSLSGVLGAGLACVIFMLTLLDGFILRPLPFAKPDESCRPASSATAASATYFRSTAATSRKCSATSRERRSRRSRAIDDQPERFDRAGALSRRPCHGESLPRARRRAVDRAGVLRRRREARRAADGNAVIFALAITLRRRPSIVGRKIRVDGQPATVIGVMPEGFTYPRNEDLWLPSTTIAESVPVDPFAYWVIARRHARRERCRSRHRVRPLVRRSARAPIPSVSSAGRSAVEPLARMAADRTTRGTLGSMLAAVVMVLLVSCANAANLLAYAHTRTLAGTRGARRARREPAATHRAHPRREPLLTMSATVLAFVLARAGVAWQRGVMRQTEFFRSGSASTSINGLLFAFAAATFYRARRRFAARAPCRRHGDRRRHPSRSRGVAGGRSPASAARSSSARSRCRVRS